MSKKFLLSLAVLLLALMAPFRVMAAGSAVPATAVQDLATGYYFIYSGVGNNKVISTMDARTNGSPAKIQIMSKADCQLFYVRRCDNGSYAIKSVYAGRYLALNGNQKTDGTQVTIQTSRSTNTAYWYLTKSSQSGYYNIMSVKARKALTVDGGANRNGTALKIYAADGTASQNFRFVKLSTTQTAEKEIVTDLATGYYRLQNQANRSRYLEVAGNSFTPKGNVRLGVTSGQQEAASIFYVENLGNGYYFITSALGGYALDVPNGAVSNGTNVRQHWPHKDRSQRWLVRKTDYAGFYTLAPSTGRTKMLDTRSNQTALGTNVIVNEAMGSFTQGWKFVKASEPTVIIPNGVYTIGTQNSETSLLTVKGGSTNENTSIVLGTTNDSNSQKFTILRTSGNYYKIVNAGSGRVLSPKGGGTTSGTDLVQATYNYDNGQIFKITGCRGRFHFVNAGSGLAIEHYAGRTTSGTNVRLATNHPTFVRQSFRLTETTVTLDSTRGYTYVTDSATNTRFKVEKQYLTDPKVGRDVTEEDFFAAVLYTEAGNQGIPGMMMVAYVILNRMDEGIAASQGTGYVPYPGTLNIMIYHYEQWQVARNGALTNVLKDVLAGEAGYLSNARQAAARALAGKPIVLTESATRYTRQSATSSTMATLPAGTTIKKSAFKYNSFMTPAAWNRFATDGRHPKFATGYGAGKNTLIYKGHVYFMDGEVW